MEPVRHIPPCPFCGNKEAPIIVGASMSSQPTLTRRVYCDPISEHRGCGAMGPPVHYTSDLTDSITKCVELWSKRV